MFVLALVIAVVSGQVAAQHAKKSHYAGQQNRAVKSLSAQDIDELQRGAGWGLAKAAELNGVPGPVHLLELSQQIGLSNEQAAKISALYEEMKASAIPLGNQLITQERQLEALFGAKLPDEEELQTLLGKIGETRSALRFVHLKTHLKTPQILSKDQIARYNELRGYGAKDPCDAVPEGHDATMWKRHNGCQ